MLHIHVLLRLTYTHVFGVRVPSRLIQNIRCPSNQHQLEYINARVTLVIYATACTWLTSCVDVLCIFNYHCNCFAHYIHNA